MVYPPKFVLISPCLRKGLPPATANFTFSLAPLSSISNPKPSESLSPPPPPSLLHFFSPFLSRFCSHEALHAAKKRDLEGDGDSLWRRPTLAQGERDEPLPSQKQKGSKETALLSDPNSLPPIPEPSPAISVANLKSPLPQQPPSLNPLKRKLSVERVPENSVIGTCESGVQVDFWVVDL